MSTYTDELLDVMFSDFHELFVNYHGKVNAASASADKKTHLVRMYCIKELGRFADELEDRIDWQVPA